MKRAEDFERAIRDLVDAARALRALGCDKLAEETNALRERVEHEYDNSM